MAQIGTFEGDLSLFNPNNLFAGDERLPVEFYIGVMKNDHKSLEAGRPIYDDVEFIRIFNSKDNIVDRPVRELDKQRWPRRYAAWKAGNQEAGVSGTRLEHWPILTRAQAEEFKYYKIFTVEQLAEAPDSQSIGIMGFQKYKALAKQTLEMAKGEAPLVKMQQELEIRDAKIAEQQDVISKLNKRLERLETRMAKAE
jgi:hypothetical protein